MTPIAVVRLLSEPHRVRIFAAVALGARTLAEIAAVAKTSPKETVLAIGRFTEQEIFVETDAGVEVNHDLLRAMTKESATASVIESQGYSDERVESLLRSFIRGGRLVRLPAQWQRKLVVLNHIAARSFEDERRYSETEINDILRGWCDGGGIDHVTIRRYLVDLQLLHRADGVYWVNPDIQADAVKMMHATLPS